MSQEKQKQASPKAELEEKYLQFQSNWTSEPNWNIFSEIVSGNNYTSSISRKLRRNKAVVSRQLRGLHQLDLIVQMGSGVKQFYEANWLTFTTYWIWFANTFVELVGDLKEWQAPERVPDWLSEFYLTDEEDKVLGKFPIKIESLLDPITPQLSEIVRHVVEVLSNSREVHSFFDAFREVSIAFGAGLPDQKYVDPRKIDIVHSRKLIETLYNPRVRVWLKLLALGNLASSNIVRNHILRLAGVITSDEISALRPRM